MPGHRRARAAAIAICAGLLAPVVHVHAQEVHRQFDIPAGPAAQAITSFAGQAGLNVLASGDALHGIRTGRVKGSFTPSEALARLLAGSGLSSRANASGAVFVLPAPATPATPAIHPPPAKAKVNAQAPLEDAGEVIVVGTRASQRSSISARKHAATAVDVIVADDVGSFPDRNIAEAISRVAGISLERGDFGEGRRIDLRGNGPERTRIEIDGMALLAAGGSDMNLGGGGRGVELRELTADLLASVTVVGGATPDMTEGSLGGTVLIKTRSSLDFKQRHLSARVAGTASSLNRLWTPTLNLIFADKFLDQRLGVLVNLTRTELRNEGHFNQNSTSGIAGYARSADLDNSPHKTFTFQPQTVNTADPAALLPLFSAPTIDGGAIDFETPAVLLAKAAGAATRADCAWAFRPPSEQDLAVMRSDAVRAGAIGFRSDALQTCLNQWNDYTPSRLRNIVKRNDDRRSNADLRIDFKVSPSLAVYAKLMNNVREVVDELVSLERGRPQFGASANLVPSSVVVDANHHLTHAVINDAAYFVDNIHNPMSSRSRYAQLGGAWRGPGIKVDFMASQSKAGFARGDARLSGVGYTYGQAMLSAQPDGSWRLDPAAGAPDQAAHERYAALLGQPDARAPQLSRTATVTYAPRASETAERQRKLDVVFHPRLAALPFMGTQKFGLSQRRYQQRAWTGTSNGVTLASSTEGPSVILPAAQVRTGISACQPGTAPDAVGCPSYGYMPGQGAYLRRGAVTLRPQEFTDLLSAVMAGRRTAPFFRGAAGRPTGLLDSWAELDVARAIELLGLTTLNHDCLKACTGSDGQVHNQPSTGIGDKVDALYWMTDFDLGALPAGMELTGNFGWRLVRSYTRGRGFVTLRAITKTPGWSAAAPYDPATLRVSTGMQDTTLAARSSDVLPMLNLMFWPLRDRLLLRYSRVKAVARHPDASLVPLGTCTWDQVIADANAASGARADMPCTGEFGNPDLPLMASTNQNLSLEWYPDRNTQLIASAYRYRGTAGAARRVQVGDDRLFAGANAALDDIEFSHASMSSGMPDVRSGWEVGAKLAFTGLPGALGHMGVDANYSRGKPQVVGGHQRDLLTGQYQDPPDVPRSTANLSLWYDDGRIKARAALQVVGATYKGLGPGFAGGVDIRNYNAVGVETIAALPWNPGSANFEEATRYVDLRFSYKHSLRLELFGEVRNATRRMVVRSQGPYNHFAGGAASINEFAYTGSRATLGLNLRY